MVDPNDLGEQVRRAGEAGLETVAVEDWEEGEELELGAGGVGVGGRGGCGAYYLNAEGC